MELPDDLQPLYSNVARIYHTPSDFLIDFARILPGQRSNPVLSRVIMSPLGAKLFLRALGENLARYETQFGEILIPQSDSGLANDLFKSVQPPNPDE
jgi:hypothetical protein